MFGLEDRYHLLKGGYRGSDGRDRLKLESLSVWNPDESVDFWFRFLPAFIYDDPERLGKVLSGNTRDLVYRIPKDVIVSDPKAIRKCLDVMFDDACQTLSCLPFFDPDNIGVHGISIGGTIATRLANQFGIGKLKLLAPGASLPDCIRVGIATKNIFREAMAKGFSVADFEEHLRGYSPINNLDNLPSDSKVEMIFGKYDRVIPYEDGLKLVEAMKVRGINPSVITRRFYGHGLAVTKSLSLSSLSS